MSKYKGQKPDARGGSFLLLPHCLLKSPAWRTASYRARAALHVLCLKHNGFNNGSIALSSADLADGLDCQNFAANAAAMGELCARGIVELTKNYPRGVRMAREYRITFIPTANASATHDYLSWQPGDAGTRGKKRLATIANETHVSLAAIAKERKLSIAAIANENVSSDAKPPKFPKPSLAIVATHIGNHVGGSPDPDLNPSENGGGPRSLAFGICPQPHVISSAPTAEELRERVLAHLGTFGRGAQSRLAEQADIPAGTFSKFIKSGGPLNVQARLRLTCSLPRAAAEERKLERVTA